MTIETWRAIPGYEGRYECSDAGRVRYLRQISKDYDELLPEPKMLAARTDKDSGYVYVSLWLNGVVESAGVHRIVLRTFVGPAPAGHVGTHRDGTRNNNTLTNLRWATQKENMADKLLHGTAQRGERGSRTKLTSLQIGEIRAATGSHRALGRQFKVSHKHIGEIKRGQSRVYD